MWSKTEQLRTTLMLAVGAALTGLVLLLAIADPLKQLELDTVDARFALRGSQPPPPDIVEVDIDDRTFQELQMPWAFPRSMHAAVIDELRRAGARAIAYDIQFTEPQAGREDAALMTAVERARGRVVLATSEVNEYGEAAIFGGARKLRALGGRAGNAAVVADADGIVRRLPYAVDGLKGLAVAVTEVAEGRPISLAELGGRDAWIDFRGGPGTITNVSFSDVLNGRIDRALFRDKVVIVGATAPSLQDDEPTSVGGNAPMSGVEIHANAISTLLRGTPLSSVDEGVRLALIGLLGMILPVVAARRSERRGVRVVLLALALAIAIGAAYLLAARLAFGAGLIVPVVYPLIALVLSMVAVAQVELTTAVLERDRTHEWFARFVPEAVVDKVIKANDEDRCLDGDRVLSTIVFCDLRGFTAFAEDFPADLVIKALNTYLTEMSEAIRGHGGTVIQYQSDGIVAAFGAPLQYPGHADAAIEAVREMVGLRLGRFNAWLHEQGLGEFRVGIGVNSGYVTSGNIGCSFRLDYTVIGSIANIASRLQKLTEDHGCQVLITKSTRSMRLNESPRLRYVGTVEIRGKTDPEVVYTLDESAPEMPDVSPMAVSHPSA